MVGKDLGNEVGMRDLKGTAIYNQSEQIVRESIVDTLKHCFKLYGFAPIETSILEFYDIASSKYGGGSEILKETYKLKDQGERELCLRYELTFKLSKLLAMNLDTRLPFRRYEIGKVFRDGPVKAGRLREFTQCDVDVVGVKGIIAEAEFIDLSFMVFDKLKIDSTIQINSRKLLFGIFEHAKIGEGDYGKCALILDKLEKYGSTSVKKELIESGISKDSVDIIFETLDLITKEHGNDAKIKKLKSILNNEQSLAGIKELEELFDLVRMIGIKGNIQYIPTLARGLGYYNGIIWEVFANNSVMKSSIAAGGRWDNMISKFLNTTKDYPACGMTFGLDAIYEVLRSKNNSKGIGIPKVLIVQIDALGPALKLIKEMRSSGVSCELSDKGSVPKAFEYANKSQIKFTMVIGKRELSNNTITIKDMDSGDQQEIKLSDSIEFIKRKMGDNSQK